MGNGRGHSSGSTYFQPDFYGNRKNGDAGDRTGSYGPYVCSFIGNFVIKPFYCYGRSYGKRRWLFLSGSRDLPWFLEKYAAVIRRSVFMFPGSCLSDDKGKKSEKYRKHPVLAICVSGGTGGPVFMNKRRETVLKDERKKRKSIETEWKGSLTVEASCVMAVVLFSLAALIGKAGQIHDETAAAMVLHEGVEKCRHEKNIQSEDAEAFFKRNAGLMLRYTDLTVSIQEKGAKKMGKVKGGDWEKQIEMKEFRPEEFMRMVTGITGGTNEN